MSTSVFARFGACISKKSMCIWLVSMFVVALALPMWAGSKNKDEETLKNATNVLQKMLNDQNIPSDVIAKADCVIVLPNVKKIGFGIDLPPSFVHEIIRQFPPPGLRLRTAEPAKQSRPQPPSSM